MRHFLGAFLAGAAAAALPLAVLVTLWLTHLLSEQSAAWKPTPVLVLARDVAAGEIVADADLLEAALPARFVSASAVPPADRGLIAGRPSPRPLRKGDLVVYPAFARETTALAGSCAEAIRSAVDAAGEAAQAEALASFAASQPELRPVLPKLSAPPGERSLVGVVVFKKDLEQGAVLDGSELAREDRPRALLTASAVPARYAERLAGARLAVSVQAGDWAMWQMLDDAAAPKRAATCFDTVGQARDKARAQAREAGTAAFLARRTEATP